MIRWSLLGEYISLIILTILFVRSYCYEAHTAFTRKKRLFLHCLVAAAASIALNIGTTYLLAVPGAVPTWLNVLLNSCYFLFIGGTCTLFALLAFRLALEHVYDPHCIRMATTVLIVLLSIHVLAVAVNLGTGILFYFDAAGVYQRGPLNRFVFLLPVIQLVFLFICYFRNRSCISNSMVYVMRTLPGVVLLLCLFQFFYPDVLLNGFLSAMVSLILFLSTQTYSEDQDSHTGIRNRTSFITELSRRTDAKQPTQIILLSLLSFSDTNLHYGHQVGDALLYEVASYLDHLYPKGRTFRVRNTTFALVLPWKGQEEAEASVQAVCQRFQTPWFIGKASCRLPFCMAVLRCDGSTAVSQLVPQLEYTLSVAKKTHGIVWFDDAIKQEMKQKQDLVHTLQRSIQEHRFRVWYQPIYLCDQDVFPSAEALLRLNDEQGNPIPPSVFIPLAEETGMIEDLTWIVLEDICRLLSSGQAPGLETVSMNLSMQQLLDADLANRIRECLDRYGLRPQQLKVEITERLLIHDVAFARKQLASLVALGVQICMDDFGTGYSNLSSVLDFPFSFIKIDRSLILHILEDSRAELMIRTLIQLFHTLGKRVIVEGVEEAEQARYLQETCGVNMIQGFYYAKPMPREELIAFLQARETHP